MDSSDESKKEEENNLCPMTYHEEYELNDLTSELFKMSYSAFVKILDIKSCKQKKLLLSPSKLFCFVEEENKNLLEEIDRLRERKKYFNSNLLFSFS